VDDQSLQRGKSTVLNTNGELLRRRLDHGLELADFTTVGVCIEGSALDVSRTIGATSSFSVSRNI